MEVQVLPGTPLRKLFPTKPMKAFLIDMDGLLINSEDVANTTFKHVLSQYGATFTDQDHSDILGTTGPQWSRALTDRFNLPIAADELREQFYQEFRKKLDESIELMPGAQAFLDWIVENGYKKALVTSAGKRNADRNIELLGLNGYFDAIITSESIEHGKPAPDPYLKGAELLGVESSECIVLEDSNAGEESGKAAGCLVIAIPTVFADKTAYDKADYIEENLVTALKTIQNLLT